jgi:integration host factor subunit alpha
MKRSNLTRKDLARAIHEKLGYSQRSASDLVDTVFASLKQTLLMEELVKIVQFGTFTVKKKTSRLGRNPRTGDSMEIAPRSMVSFKPSKILREKLNT